MRTEPENDTLKELFEDEADLVEVWTNEFPVKRNDWIRARHINALWAALTERGRIVGLQVWDWTVGEGLGSGDVAGSGSGSGERRWNWPVNGAVRPDDRYYWDGFKENDILIEADEVSHEDFASLLTAVHAVCQRYVHPDEERGFLGLGDLLGYVGIGEVEIENDYWPTDEWTGQTALTFDNYGFPVVPDRTEGSIADRFLYKRFRPGSWHKENIEINDPRFSINGGGYGPAQYFAWLFNQSITLPSTVNVRISTANKGEPIPEDDEDTIGVPLPFFHEHINAIYYMIRALEYYPYIYSEFPDPLGYTLQVSGGEIDLKFIGTSFCLPGRSQSPEKLVQEWIQYCTEQIQRSMSNSAASIGGGILSANAFQGSRFYCPAPPVGTRTWDCVNFRQATFIPFIPKFRPWDDSEASLFPGGFASAYNVQSFRLWLQGGYETFTRRDNVTAGAGWGGTAHLRYEPSPFVPPSMSNHFTLGSIVMSIPIDGNIVDFSSSNDVSAASLPNTINQFTLDAFSLHFDLDPGKWTTLNLPVNKPPREVAQGILYTNMTASGITMQARVATKIEDHLYRGGKVAKEDQQL